MRDELGGAGVDARVDGADAVALAQRADVVLASCRASFAICAVAEAEALGARRGRRARDAPAAQASSSARDDAARIWARNHGSIAVSSWSARRVDADAHRVGDVEEPVGASASR